MLLWQKQFVLRAPDGRSVRGHGKVQAQNDKERIVLSIKEMQKRAKRCLMYDHGRWIEIPATEQVGMFATMCKTQDERLVFVVTDEGGRMLAAGETEPPMVQWQRAQQEVDRWLQAQREKRRVERRVPERTHMVAPKHEPGEKKWEPVQVLIDNEPVELESTPPKIEQTAAQAIDAEKPELHEPTEICARAVDEPALEAAQAPQNTHIQTAEQEESSLSTRDDGVFHTTIQPRMEMEREGVQGPVLPGPWHWQRVESTETFSYLLGQLPDDSGAPKAVAVAIPGEYAPAPPAYLQGFTFHRQGYWVLIQDAKTGRVMERVG